MEKIDKINLQKYQEEINRYERELEERHRESQRKELREFFEEMDREASKELLKFGGYRNKGLVKRTIMTGVGKVVVKVHRYIHKNGQNVYPLRDICGIGNILHPKHWHITLRR